MHLRVIGAHLPRLDQAGIARFIADDVASFKATMLNLVSRGVSTASAEEIEERSLELPGELEADLQRCALFEIEVQDNDREFDPSDLNNPETGYAGWEPVFLSPDGESIVTEAYRAPASLTHFRFTIYIQEWDSPGRLVGPIGELSLPPFTPVPARLWKLAPYSCVD
jgi:hypothetical protein